MALAAWRPAAVARGLPADALEVIMLPEAKKGVVVLPRRWVGERSFAWATRFRRLAKDDERLPETVAGLHFVAFACLMLHRLLTVAAQSP
jgi:transposase